MTDWDIIEALGTWFTGIAMIATIAISIWHFNTQHERKIRILLKMKENKIEIRIMNEGNKSLRIDSFGFFRGGKYITLQQNESSKTTTSEQPFITEIAKEGYEERLSEAMANISWRYESNVRMFVDGGGSVYFSKIQYASDLKLRKNNEEKIKLKKWRFEPKSAVKFVDEQLILITLLLSTLLTILSIPLGTSVEFGFILYPVITATTIIFVHLRIQRYFKNRLESWTETERKKNIKSTDVLVSIQVITSVVLFLTTRNFEPVFTIVAMIFYFEYLFR